MTEAVFRERLQAIIDWADLAMKNADEFDSHGVRNLDGPVFDAAREALAKDPSPQTRVLGDAAKKASAKALFWELENHDRCPPEARDATRRHKTVTLIMQRLDEAFPTTSERATE